MRRRRRENVKKDDLDFVFLLCAIHLVLERNHIMQLAIFILTYKTRTHTNTREERIFLEHRGLIIGYETIR